MGGDDIDFGPIASSDDFDSDPEVWDLIVVGAGVAGSAFAFGQAKTGRRVLIIERDLSQPDRIVGELLQPGGYLTLKRLGLDSCVTGIDSQQVHGYALFKEGETAVLKYPTEEYAPGVCGHSFHHGRFVQSLRQKLQGQPNVTIRAGTVRKLLTGNRKEWQGDKEEVVTGVVYKAADGSEREARGHLNVVCDGMYSTFRKKFVDPDIKFPSYFVGIILRNCNLPFPNHGHVVLAKPSPILFYPISSTEVRCLVDVPGTKLPRAAGGELQSYLRSHVALEVPESVRAAFLAAVEDSDNIRAMQNKQLAASPLLQPGALLLGDAFNMRHPLTGGGMTVALADCHLLCEMLKPLPGFGDTAATASSTRDFFVARKGCSATINTLANALYQVFSYSPVEAHEHMRQACFDYLKLGGIYSSGPVSLLSGLNPRPHVLVMHFFMVALFGVGRMLWPPTPHRLYMAVALIWIACGIIFPIIAAEGVAAVFFPALARRPRMPRNLSRSRLTAAAQQLKVD